jgi:hypothetical protein
MARRHRLPICPQPHAALTVYGASPGALVDRYRELLHAWKDADNAAKLADQLLSQKFDAYLTTKGAPMPTEAERQQAARLRVEANMKLAAAIDYLNSKRSG